jgi:penicillin-binding protein 1C
MRRWLVAGVLAVAGLTVASAAAWRSFGRIDAAALRPPPCRLVVDRRGKPLRFVPDRAGERHLFVPLDGIPRRVRDAFLAAEDERFHDHRGADFRAILRAALQNARAGRVVSGASTITQQLCRLSAPRPRTLLGKGVEILRSIDLERRFSKREILERYLNRVPLGNNVVGVEAASRLYFGRGVAEIGTGEAALLAALPKAPGTLDPYGPNRERLEERRRWVLERMAALGSIDPGEAARAADAAPAIRPRAFPMGAPHAVDLVVARAGPPPADETLATTIELDLQERVEAALASHRERLRGRGVTQGAVVVIDNRRMEVAALAGSFGWGPRDGGFNNGAAALRSPGSALKPFLYALALDRGIGTSEILDDTERTYRVPGGEYVPENYNRVAYGPVPLRDALGNSLNLSSIELINRLGYPRFWELLGRLDLVNFPSLGADHYGLGLVVGNPEVSPLQLAAAYAALANGGIWRPARLFGKPEGDPPRQVFSPQATWIISRILSDPSSRAVSFGSVWAMNALPGLAVKTGTSSRYRDCWAAGFTADWTAVVWTGNFDGGTTWGMSGAAAAAPVLADIFALLHPHGPAPPPARPDGVVEAAICPQSGKRHTAGCPEAKTEVFLAGTEPAAGCDFHAAGGAFHGLPAKYADWLDRRRSSGAEGRYRLAAGRDPDVGEPLPAARDGVAIVYPLEGDRYLLEPGDDQVTIELKAVSGSPVEQVTWFVDGVELGAAGPPYTLECALGRGPHVITAMGASAAGDEIRLTVE